MKIKDALKATAKATGLSVDALLGADRTKPAVYARHAGLYAASLAMPELGCTDLGRHWGGQDRTTVEYALQQARARVTRRCPQTMAVLADVLAQLDLREVADFERVEMILTTRALTLAGEVEARQARLGPVNDQVDALRAVEAARNRAHRGRPEPVDGCTCSPCTAANLLKRKDRNKDLSRDPVTGRSVIA